jgi:hypothetical protein
MSTTVDWTCVGIYPNQTPLDRVVEQGNANVTVTVDAVSDPVSTAVNNYRVACSGSAARGYNLAQYRLTNRAQFSFDISSTGRLFSSASFAPQGRFTLVAQRPHWFMDLPGSAVLKVSARTSTEVNDEEGTLVRVVNTRPRTLLLAEARASNTDARTSGIVDIAAFDEVIQVDIGLTVRPGFFVTMFAQYTFNVMALNSAGFAVDFATFNPKGDPPGDGLNVPFASVSIV